MSENRTLDNRIKKWLKTVENPTIKMIKKKAKQLNPSPYLKIQSWFEKFKSKNKDIFKKTEDQ